MQTAQLLYDTKNGWNKIEREEILNPQVILLFGTGKEFVQNAYKELHKKFPQSDIIGCSTAGTIAGTRVDDISVATLISFKTSSVKVIFQEFKNADESEELGVKIANSFEKDGLRHLFVLSDGLHINGSHLTTGLNRALPKSVSATGGLAGDSTAFEHTYIIANADAKELPASGLKFLFSIRKDASKQPIIRTLLGINEEDQSLTFAGDVPEMYRCRLMKSNINKLIDHAGFAAKEAKSKQDSNKLCLAVSCVGRRIVLSQLVEEEIDAIQEVLGEETLLSGFYSYGEIAPVKGFKECDLHNQTMTLTLINENI